MFSKKIIIFTLCFLTFTLFSQNFEIKGKIIPNDSTIVVSGLHVFNSNTQKGNITNFQGDFIILVSVGDTITVSGLQIKKVQKVIDKVFQTSEEIKIYVELQTNELDEVFIGSKLSGSIYIDSKLIKDNQVVDAVSLGLPFAGLPKKTQTQRAIYTATTGPGGGIPLDPIINRITGYLKKLKKREKIEEKDKLISCLEENFKNYLLSDLLIEKNSINDFLGFCYEDKAFKSLYEKGEIHLINLFRQKSLIYNSRSK